MRLAVHFPVYRRQALAQVSAAGLARILSELEPDGITARVLVIGNEQWAERMAAAHGWEYLTASNSPLGAKFDAGARHIADRWTECTHFMEWGADNIMSDQFTALLRSMKGSPVHCITSNAFYMLREGTNEVRLFHRGAGSNIGRLTRMDVVRAIRRTGAGRIYDHEAKRGLDRSFRMKVQAVTGRTVKLHKIAEPYIIDVKGRGSLNGWATFEARPDRFPLVEVEGTWPELNKIRETWQPPESSGATRSTSTSTPCKAPTPSTEPSRTTRGKLSPAAPAPRSRASSKPSTPRAKTKTARGKS